jgi:hypothetical protein
MLNVIICNFREGHFVAILFFIRSFLNNRIITIKWIQCDILWIQILTVEYIRCLMQRQITKNWVVFQGQLWRKGWRLKET